MVHFKKRPFTGLFLLLILYDPFLFGGGYTPNISTVEFYGNTKTLDYVLEREIQHPIDSPLDSVLAEADRNRLEKRRLVHFQSMKKIQGGHLRAGGSFRIFVDETKHYNWEAVMVVRILMALILSIPGCLGIMFPCPYPPEDPFFVTGF